MTMPVKELLMLGEKRLANSGVSNAKGESRDLYCYRFGLNQRQFLMEWQKTREFEDCESYLELLDLSLIHIYNLVNSIEKSRKTTAAKLLYGLGIPGVGVATAKSVSYTHLFQIRNNLFCSLIVCLACVIQLINQIEHFAPD